MFLFILFLLIFLQGIPKEVRSTWICFVRLWWSLLVLKAVGIRLLEEGTEFAKIQEQLSGKYFLRSWCSPNTVQVSGTIEEITMASMGVTGESMYPALERKTSSHSFKMTWLMGMLGNRPSCHPVSSPQEKSISWPSHHYSQPCRSSDKFCSSIQKALEYRRLTHIDKIYPNYTQMARKTVSGTSGSRLDNFARI